MSDLFISALKAGGYATSGADAHSDLQQVVPVVVQCFDPETLRYLHNNTDLPMVSL